MPNWVYTELSVEGESPLEIQLFMDAVASDDSFFDFNKIIPMPDDIYTGNLGADERRIYGEKNWFDWSIMNWGTKWNACEANRDLIHEDDDKRVYYWFETAWSFCKPVMKALIKQFPNLHFSGRYADEDIGYNCGEFWGDGGDLRVDECGDGSKDAIEFACDVLGIDSQEYLAELGEYGA